MEYGERNGNGVIVGVNKGCVKKHTGKQRKGSPCLGRDLNLEPQAYEAGVPTIRRRQSVADACEDAGDVSINWSAIGFSGENVPPLQTKHTT